MHPSILGAGLLLLAGAATAARAACPAPQAALREVFIAAACADCWAAPGVGRRGPHWRFDWITPDGPEAPLAAAALPESAERRQRGPALAEGEVLRQRGPAPLRLPAGGLAVSSGPAWQGYFGVQLRLSAAARRALPAGSSAWLALVEQVPAGSEGTVQARALVRSVAGPLPLTGAAGPLTHLRALRWPEGAQPTRLQARGWIESPEGRILAVAADRCP